MKKTYLIVLFALLTFYGTEVFSQQPDSLKQVKINSLRKDLSIDKSNAEKVIQVMDEYKLSAKAVIENNVLSETEKRDKLNLLIDDKNANLKKLLNEKQLEKVIPTTEKRNADKSKAISPKG